MANNNIFGKLNYKDIPIHTIKDAEVCVAFITKPSYEYSDDGQYFLRIRLKTNSFECGDLITTIEAARNKAFNDALELLDSPKAKKNLKKAEPSYKEEEDDDGNPTGYTVFNFKQKASFINKKGEEKKIDIPIFDRVGQPITGEDKEELMLWSGSTIGVAFRLIPYYTERLGVGVTQRLEAVQVIKALSGATREAKDYGFTMQAMPEIVDEPVADDESDY